MKKIIIGITIIASIVAAVFAALEIKDYYSTKKNNDGKKMIEEVTEKIKNVEEEIKEKTTEEEKLREENKDKIEVIESWQKKKEEMESYLS